MQPAVITSKPAQRAFMDIKDKHAVLLQDLTAHKAVVDNRKQQKAAAEQSQLEMNHELAKAKMVADTQAQKNALDFQQKQAELDVKRAALASTD